MYVVIVQSVFVEYRNWNVINWYILTTNSFAVVCVVKISNANVLLYNTLRNVLLSWDKAMFNQRVDMCLFIVSLRHTSGYVHACLGSHVFLWWSFSLMSWRFIHVLEDFYNLFLERKLLLIKLILIYLKCWFNIHYTCKVQELTSHQLLHSAYKQFCCGLCSNDFKCKRYVIQLLIKLI